MDQERPGNILQNSALVNELYLQLAKLDSIDWKDRNHFYAVCAQMMRHILTSYARAQFSLKRGGNFEQITMDDSIAPLRPDRWECLVAFNDALCDLAAFDQRMLEIVELRALVGLSVEETAIALNISESTVKREWHAAKLWLLRELSMDKRNGQ